MSAQNDFIPFATGVGANVLATAGGASSAYGTNGQTTSGQQPGVASSALNNTALRQATFVASCLAQFIANQTASYVQDNGSQSAFLAMMATVFPSPTGTILAFGGSSAPVGYLLCAGTAISRTTYAALFAVIGTTYGVGDGSTTFNIPNTQGVFLRGAGSQTISGISYSSTLGASQGDQMQGHWHTVTGGGSANIVGVGGSGSPNVNTSGGGFSYVGVTSPSSDGTNGTPRTGGETRPANISVNYIIKT